MSPVDFVNEPQNGRERFIQRTTEARRAREEWTAANPRLAAEWDEANAEDTRRSDAAQNVKEAARKREVVSRLCQDVGMPLRAMAALPGRKETEAIRKLGAKPAGITLLAGPPGTGKTLAAVAAAHAAMAEAFEANPERVKENPFRVAIFARAVTMARGSAYGHEAQSAIRDATSTRLLVLDDLGAEFASPVWDMLLFEILDTRHGNMLPTILTSNLGGEAFVKRYGTRMLERIKEDGRAIFLNGESMRGAT